MTESNQSPSCMSWSGQEALPVSGSSQKSSRMSGSGRETYPDIREWSGCPLGCPRVVRRPSRKFWRPSRLSGRGAVAFPNVQGWTEGPPG